MTHHETHQGSLRDVALADILRDLLSSKATGILNLQNNGQEKSIYLQEGNIVFASSNLLEDRLGNILVRAGKLTQEQAEAVLKLKGATQKKFGAIIVELGFMTPKDLFDGLKLQVKEIIFSLFRWEDGLYRFAAGQLPSQTIPLILDPIQLISEIIFRLKENPGDGI